MEFPLDSEHEPEPGYHPPISRQQEHDVQNESCLSNAGPSTRPRQGQAYSSTATQGIISSGALPSASNARSKLQHIAPTSGTSASVTAPFASHTAPSAPAGIPPSLHAFLTSLRIKQTDLAPIFIKYGFDTGDALDFLCELPSEDWADMKAEIVAQARFSEWLAVHKGLQARAQALRMRAC